MTATDKALEECIAQAFGADPTVRLLTRDILRLQKRLRREVGDQAWRTYMQIEAVTNHRHDEILRRVVERLTGTAQR
jgi:hypothetical protein